MSLKLTFSSLPSFLCLDDKTGDDRARHLARYGDEVILLRLYAAHHVVHEFVLHIVVAQGVELDAVGIDGREEHHLLQPPGFRGRLDHFREEVDVSLRVDNGEIVTLPDVLLDDGLHEPRLADAGGPEAAEVTASFRSGTAMRMSLDRSARFTPLPRMVIPLFGRHFPFRFTPAVLRGRFSGSWLVDSLKSTTLRNTSEERGGGEPATIELSSEK